MSKTQLYYFFTSGGIQSLLFAFLGWLSGIASLCIVDRIRCNRERARLKKCICSELEELRYSLVCVCLQVSLFLGNLQRELFVWALPWLMKYDGVQKNQQMEQLEKEVERILKMNATEFPNWSQSAPRMQGAIGLNKYSLPFITSRASELSLFNDQFQRRALEILMRLEGFNQEVERAAFFLERTFDGGIAPEKQKALTSNLHLCWQSIAAGSRMVVDRISALLALE